MDCTGLVVGLEENRGSFISYSLQTMTNSLQRALLSTEFQEKSVFNTVTGVMKQET